MEEEKAAAKEHGEEGAGHAAHHPRRRPSHLHGAPPAASRAQSGASTIAAGGDFPPLPTPGPQLTHQNRPSYFAQPQPTHSTARNRLYSMGSDGSGMRPLQTQPSRATPLEGINEDYLRENPWYGEAKKKPVFSLGHTLPHTVRPRKAAPQPTKPRADDVEAAAHPPADAQQPPSGDERPPSTLGRLTSLSEHSRLPPDQVPHLFRDTSRFAVDAEPLGHREQQPVEDGERDPDELRNWWARMRARHPEPLAEFLATFLSIFLGIAGTLVVKLTNEESGIYGTFETAWSWGFSWMLGIYIASGVSGAHMNPSISFALSVYRRFPWYQCAIYVLVQLLAGATAGALAYAVFQDAIKHYDPEKQTGWKSFCSAPEDWMTTGGVVCSQIVQSAIMVTVVFALGDDQNDPPGAGMHAFILGLLVTTLQLTLGHNTGSALNPAADLGPRLVTLWMGYDRSALFGNPFWAIGPWLANVVGTIFGGALYDLFIFVGSESPVNHRIPRSIWPKREKN